MENATENQNLTPREQKEKDLATLWEKTETRAAELKASKNRAILPILLPTGADGDYVVGYMYEMDGFTDTKLMAAKLEGVQASFPKAVQAVESLILFEESDERIRQKKYLNGAALQLLSLVETSTPLFKKK